MNSIAGHDVPRDSLLRPDAGEAVRPRAAELWHAVIVVEEEVLRAGLLGGGCFRNFAMWCISNPPPAPGHRQSPWGGVVVRLGQEHRDGSPFMSQELA